MKYKHIFFDLDRTLWDFERNMQITLHEIYERHNLKRNIPSFEDFITSYNLHNERLWKWYQQGQMKKEVLRYKRFELTLKEFGFDNKELAKVVGQEYINESPKKTALIPNTLELLEYLHPNYSLHIITNGFNEVQFTKLKLCGISNFFEKVVTSEISGHHKPRAGAFGYSLSTANAKKRESIMIGDDLHADIIGAKAFGIDQVFFNPKGTAHSEILTYEVKSLRSIMDFL
ncbi:MAG: YjjG family noncanonical pyrimidine nucleotidase [Bacteroidales bacterium]